MSVIKKGFVVYFNNYPLMSALPFEQQGMLFSALMIYADRVWRDRSVTLEEVLEGFPRLSPETRMACGFMGAAIQRDTDAWLNRREYRQQGKTECQKRGDPETADRRAREDMDRLRRLLEQETAKGEV
ncbi:DUF6291 domain-containing protein [Oscillospiraceae bacterium 50-58]